MTERRVGQYWTPDEGEALIAWWNTQPNLPKATWVPSVHRPYLESANFVVRGTPGATPRATGSTEVSSSAPVFRYSKIEVVGHPDLPLPPLLFVAEMLRDGARGPACVVWIGNFERDPRYVERLVPNLIEELGLDLHFEVHEFDQNGVRLVRLASLAQSLPTDWEAFATELDAPPSNEVAVD